MVLLSLADYDGKQLTLPEIDYITCINGERNRIKQDQMEKALQRQLLSQISIAQEAAKNAIKSTEIESSSNHAYILQQHQQQAEDDSAAPIEKRPFKKPQLRKSVAGPTLIPQDDVDAAYEQEELPTGDLSSFKPIRKRKLAEEIEEPEIEFFASEGIIFAETWCSMNALSNLSLLLPNFGVESYNNTIGIQAKVERPCRGWALNISPANDRHSMDILFHFNPRYGKANEIVMNDRIGTWGNPMKIAMRDQNQKGILATDIQLKIQIREEGFVVYTNDLFCAFFAHRRRYDNFKDLRIVLLAADDNGKKEEVIVEKVWWGHQDFRRHTLSPNIMSLIRKVVNEKPEIDPFEQRTILLKGLPIYTDLEILQGLEYAVLDQLEEFCPVEKVSLVPGQGIGYIRMRKAEDVIPTIEGSKDRVVYDKDGSSIPIDNMCPLIQSISV